MADIFDDNQLPADNNQPPADNDLPPADNNSPPDNNKPPADNDLPPAQQDMTVYSWWFKPNHEHKPPDFDPKESAMVKGKGIFLGNISKMQRLYVCRFRRA